MEYQTFALRWRPQTFDEVVGQEHITTTLKNAIRQNRIAHAYLFAGPRGTGKTSTARILAKALNCKEGPKPEPCNKCENCKEITASNSLDVLEIDGASNRGIDEIRALKENVKLS
ncbi:MAG TPA: AAA family ATPase, partial [Candidatus Omnitrophica bacterium]|nr:AAA family ATPase [Candidatus Omnitrophota bacterium]